MQNIYKRPDSKCWWASWSDESGKQNRRSTKIKITDDPKGTEAEKVRSRFILESTQPEAIGQTWIELLDAYMTHLKTKVADKTFKRYVMAMIHLVPAFQDQPAQVKGQEVRAYIQNRLKVAKPATVNKEIALMGGMYNFAQRELEWEILNPWKGRTVTTNNERDRWLTKDEAERLIACSSPLVADFIRLVLNTGMRPGEALALDWDRVDMDRGMILFGKEDQKNRKHGGIPINAEARLALQSRKEAKGRIVSRWVFCDCHGMRIQSVRKGFASACERAKIENVKPHDLRRTFASWLVQSGVSIQTVSGLLRHSDISITHKVYAHLSVEHLRDATRVLETPPKLKIVK